VNDSDSGADYASDLELAVDLEMYRID